MIRTVQCLTVECDRCGDPMDDFTDETGSVIHFLSRFELVAHLGGEHDGQLYAGTGRTGGVLMPGGVFYCYRCKIAPHGHVPGRLIAEVCDRCGQTRDEHDVPPHPRHHDLPKRNEQRRLTVGLSTRATWCVTSCAGRHQYDLGDLPEPADRSRIEFVFQTDRYAAWRDIESSVLAGYPDAMSWTVYPDSVGHTWACLQQTFGPSLQHAILLAPAGTLRPVTDSS